MHALCMERAPVTTNIQMKSFHRFGGAVLDLERNRRRRFVWALPSFVVVIFFLFFAFSFLFLFSFCFDTCYRGIAERVIVGPLGTWTALSSPSELLFVVVVVAVVVVVSLGFGSPKKKRIKSETKSVKILNSRYNTCRLSDLVVVVVAVVVVAVVAVVAAVVVVVVVATVL